MSIFKGIGALELNKSELTYRWKIENYGISYKNLDKCLTSPEFSTMYSDTVKQWRIRLYPKSPEKIFENYSSIALEHLSDGKAEVSIKFSILDMNTNAAVNKTDLGAQVFLGKYESHGYSKFVDRTNALLQKDTLTVVCEISSVQPLAVPKPIRDDGNDNNDLEEHKLEGVLDKLFESEMLSDVTVAIGENRKPLHKAILASRSEVFRAMFEHDMIEKKRSVVDIVDIRLEVAMEMFRYVYTGKVNNLEKWADELLMAAEKYAIAGLKIMCEKTLYSKLSFDNALGYLTLAAMYNTVNLKTQVIEFVATNLNDFVDKPQFKSLDQSIMCELLTAVAKKKTKY